MTCIVRNEEPADIPAIFAVNCECFPTDAEAQLVDALRAAGRLSVSLVAVVDNEVIGHVAFSPVMTEDRSIGLGLGPLAVVKAHRNKGIGAHLVRTGLLACKTSDCGWAVVLGDPAYYARFGFETGIESSGSLTSSTAASIFKPSNLRPDSFRPPRVESDTP